MAKYHLFKKFLAKKNTVSKINGKLSLFLELKFQKLEFLISSATVAQLSWNVRLKKIMWYSSLVNSSTMQHNNWVYQARVPFINKMQKILFLRYSSLPCKFFFFFFFLFGDHQQINIKIKISSFFYVFIYLNRSIVKYRDFNFKIWI